MKVTTVGIDLAKNVFQLHGVNEFGKTVIKKQLRRDQMALMASSNSPTHGHLKFPQAARLDYDGSALIAMRAAASLSL